MRTGILSALLAVVCTVGASGCFTVEGNEAITDRYLEARSARSIEELEASRRRDVAAAALELASGADEEAGELHYLQQEVPEDLVLDLQTSLRLALSSSRRFLDARESVDLSALALRDAEHLFEPRLASTLDALMTDSRNGPRAFTQGADLRLEHRNLIGGSLSLEAGSVTSQLNPAFGDTLNSTLNRVGATYRQPLLRGAGREVASEPLTQSQRNLVYAVRDFDLFRQDFALDVLRGYYNLVLRSQVVDNAHQNLEVLTELHNESVVLRDIGRADDLDILRVEQQRLTAENSVIDSEDGFASLVDDFKILLGLPVDADVELDLVEPEFVAVNISAARAIQIAFAYRLDYLTEKDLLEDAERQLRLAANNLLPDVDVRASVDLITDPADDPWNADFERRAWSVGASIDLPLDRVAARNSYRATRIRLQRRQRQLALFRDNLANQVRATLRRLQRTESTIVIQRRIVEEEEKRYRIANLRYTQGETENRDVVEAAQSYNDAQDRMVQNIVDYEIARIQLQRDMGILIVDPDGGIIE